MQVCVCMGQLHLEFQLGCRHRGMEKPVSKLNWRESLNTANSFWYLGSDGYLVSRKLMWLRV